MKSKATFGIRQPKLKVLCLQNQRERKEKNTLEILIGCKITAQSRSKTVRLTKFRKKPMHYGNTLRQNQTKINQQNLSNLSRLSCL